MKFFHPSIVPSIGASARLPTIEAAIIIPPVSSPLQRKPCAPAEDRDLRAQAHEFGDAGHDDVAVLREDLRFQGLGGLPAPHGDRFRDHAHGVDDLGVARHGVRLQVGAGAEGVGAAERDGRDLLVEIGEDEENEARPGDNPAEVGMDEENRERGRAARPAHRAS